MPISPMWRQLSIVAATLFGSVSAGASMGYSTVLIYQLKKKDSEFPIDIHTASWIGAIHGLSGIFGAVSPLVVQWKGRKLAFIATGLILVIGWVLVYTANSITMILLSETLLGFSASVMLTVSYDILTEMITPAYRNISGQSYCALNALGIAMAGAMTRFLHWRVISMILCFPAVISVLIACTWLESPLWLAYKGELDKCKINFIKLRGTEEHSIKELQEVIAAHKERAVESKKTKKEPFVKRIWLQVSSKDFAKPALHILILLFHLYWSGTVVILIYSIELLTKATKNEEAAFIGGIIINVVFVIGSSISNILVKFFKNKTVSLLSSCGAAVCLLCASVVSYLQSVDCLPKDSLLTLYFVVVYVITTSSGQVPVELTMSTELIPVKHRGLGGAMYSICACSLNSFALKASPYLFMYIGLWGTFLVFSIVCLVCGILIWKYVTETKGKTLQEIENFYSHGTFEIKLSNEEILPLELS